MRYPVQRRIRRQREIGLVERENMDCSARVAIGMKWAIREVRISFAAAMKCFDRRYDLFRTGDA